MQPMSTSLLAVLLISQSAMAPVAQTSQIALWRLDCGHFENTDMSQMSDDDRYRGQRRNSANGCYLIQHGDEYLLWDAGIAVGARIPFASGAVIGPEKSIVAQMTQLGVTPEQVRYIGISHWHPDHTSQASDFSKATLLIGTGDWALFKSPPEWMKTDVFSPWLTGGSTVEPMAHDKDVFGDGTVVMLATPGHTAGHHSLLVRLRKTGVVLLSGDLYALRESYDHDVVPSENVDRADTLASFDRFKRLVARYKARVIIQHEPADIARLPAFPEAAR
jgi:glyoxylase-like metal-dependent hydrolase (beta-lactamase superfamily II)